MGGGRFYILSRRDSLYLSLHPLSQTHTCTHTHTHAISLSLFPPVAEMSSIASHPFFIETGAPLRQQQTWAAVKWWAIQKHVLLMSVQLYSTNHAKANDAHFSTVWSKIDSICKKCSSDYNRHFIYSPTTIIADVFFSKHNHNLEN